MHRRSQRVGATAIPALILIVNIVGAQATGSRVDSGAPQDTAARRRPIDSSDIAAWKRIRSSGRLSNDGKWFAYILSSNEDDDELIVRSTTSSDEMRFAVGQYGGPYVFTADSRWLIYRVAPSREAAQGSRAAEPAAGNTVVVLELSTRQQLEFDSIQRFSVGGARSRTLVLEPYAAPVGDTSRVRGTGRDLIVYDLARGTKRTLPHVRDFAFDATGRWIAWTVDAGGQVGHGLHVLDLETGVDRVLDDDRAFYRGLRWADRSSDRLAVLKGVADSARADTLYSLLWYTGVSRGAPRGDRFDPRRGSSVPAGMTIATTEPLRWSEDHDAIFFGIRPVRERPSATATGRQEGVNLVLWHWNDSPRDERDTYLSVLHLRQKRFVRLADHSLRNMDVAPRDSWALGYDATPYEPANHLTGRHHVDLYAVDVRTGTRRLLAKRYLLIFGLVWAARYFLSPDGVHVLTWADGAYTVHDMATGASHPLVRRGGPVFGVRPYDYSPHHAPITPLAWSKDGTVVILSDGWDLWAVPIRGGTPVNLTINGTQDGIVYGGPQLMESQSGSGFPTPTVDLSRPWYVDARARWGMETGYVRINGRTPGVQRVLWDQGRFSFATKAGDADVVVFRRGTAIEFPDYYLTDLSFSKPRRITDANPQQRELLWPSGTLLVDYKGPHGERLQAALLLPANYQRGKRYPAITLIYERESFRRNYYAGSELGPNPAEGVDAVRYASRGYVIIYPDINYVQDRPGTSALHCVLAAARAAAAAGVVDSTRVGLAGHSWGGYESAFIATQTPFFKAVLAAAGPTDMISAYAGDRGSRTTNSALTESDQMRLTQPYWRDAQSYIRESPVFHVDSVRTPVLLVHSEGDDVVDWRQGIEFFSAMRRASKPIVLLQYVGQGHTTGGAAARDLNRRAQEFFDHFLMGAPAPRWWTEGVPDSGVAVSQQGRGVRFASGVSWPEVQATARAANKYVFTFVHVCAPGSRVCQFMDSVFSQHRVGAAINDKFVAVRVHGDTSGRTGAQTGYLYVDAARLREWKVTTLPHFLFFGPDGRLVHRGNGAPGVEAFLALVADAQNPARQYDVQLERYERGIKDYGVMTYLARTARTLNDTVVARRIARDYIDHLSANERYAVEHVRFIARFTERSSDPGFGMFYEHADTIDRVVGENGYAQAVIGRVITAEDIDPLVFPGGQPSPGPDWAAISTAITRKYGARHAERLVLDAQIRWSTGVENWQDLVHYTLLKLRRYGSQLSDDELNGLAWDLFSYSDDKDALTAAIVVMEPVARRVERDTAAAGFFGPAYIDTYANLLYKVGRTVEAIGWEEKAVQLSPRDSFLWRDHTRMLEKMRRGEPTWPQGRE